MRDDAEINVEDNDQKAGGADGEGKPPTKKAKNSKLSVACRFPYLTIKENDELPKRYRKAGQAKTYSFVLAAFCFFLYNLHVRVKNN